MLMGSPTGCSKMIPVIRIHGAKMRLHLPQLCQVMILQMLGDCLPSAEALSRVVPALDQALHVVDHFISEQGTGSFVQLCKSFEDVLLVMLGKTHDRRQRE